MRLTSRSRPAALLLSLISALVLVSGLTVATAPSASAGDVKICKVKIGGVTKYVVCGGGTTGTPGNPAGGGEVSEPPCDLTQSPYNEFCEGTVACWGNNPAANDEDAVADELGTKPGDDYHVAYKACADGSDEWYWTKDDEGPTTEELALEAYGQLRFPDFTMMFNPPGRTFVNLDTWWWAQGANDDPLIGTAALGVRAVAEPDHMEVDPGDGRGAFNCRFVTEKSDECVHTYRRASVRGTTTDAEGRRAYAGRMRLVYTVRFEIDGAPLEVEGVPTGFTSDWIETPVPVLEIQTVVRPRR